MRCCLNRFWPKD